MDLVTVTSFPTAVEAEAVRGMLEAEGIRAVLVDAHLNTAHPFMGLAVGQVGLQVERSRAGQAAELLRRHREEVLEAREAEADGEDPLVDRCISCGASFPEYLERCPACGLSYS